MFFLHSWMKKSLRDKKPLVAKLKFSASVTFFALATMGLSAIASLPKLVQKSSSWIFVQVVLDVLPSKYAPFESLTGFGRFDLIPKRQ